MSLVKDRIIQIADYKGLNREIFLKKLSTSYSNYRGKSKKSSPSTDVLVEISSQYPDINPTWLLTGKGEMLLEEEPAVAVAESTASYGKMPTVIEINPEAAKTNTLIADVHASAGFGSIVDNHEELERLPAIHLPDAPYGLNVAFQIQGDSMHSTIRHADFVAGNKIEDVADIRDGHTYVIVDERDGVLCKRIYRQGEAWKIVSDNPKYPPYNRDNGKIIAFFRAFCRWSYDFRNYHDDIRADISTLQQDVAEIKRDLKM